MTPQETLAQIRKLTSALVRIGLSDQQNYPSTDGKPSAKFEITVKNAAALACALKNVPYSDIYAELESARCFNIKMLDGAMISIRYRFQAGAIREHSLCYFPSPDLQAFQSEPEVYLMDDIYADVVARNIVAFPIRFDYSSDASKFVEFHHPYSHLTLGQYVNCRIPVCSPVGPLAFGGFILRNFYNTAFRKYSEDIPVSASVFATTITPNERSIPHMVCGI